MKKKVLYIEDNAQNLYLVNFILDKIGCEVFQARDGRDGIEQAVNVKPDLILLDIQLPGIDGYAVARVLRENAELKQTPIVALSSYAMVGDREKALAAGCSDYIEKPINPDIFAGQISRFLADK